LSIKSRKGQGTSDVIARVLLVEGIVQGVGFRSYVVRVARRFSISGTVQNLNNGTVRIVVQAALESLENFEREIKNAPEPIVVDLITSKETRVSPRLKHFSIVTGSLAREMMEGSDTMASLFGDRH